MVRPFDRKYATILPNDDPPYMHAIGRIVEAAIRKSIALKAQGLRLKALPLAHPYATILAGKRAASIDPS
jgi:hypothetical protein